jgi:hypothetical protein
MTIEKMKPSGGYLITDTIDGQFVKRRYFQYTKKEAVFEFKQEFKQNKKTQTIVKKV